MTVSEPCEIANETTNQAHFGHTLYKKWQSQQP